MGRLEFLTAVVLGAAAAIAAVLAVTLVVLLATSGERPSLLRDYAALWRAVLLFGALAMVAGTALVGLRGRRRWRWIAQASMWLALLAIGCRYWPRGVP